MPWPYILRILCSFFLIFAVVGCATTPPPKKPPVPQPPVAKSYWKDEGITGEPTILIDLAAQRAHFFKGQTEVGQSLISSGKKGFETPPGEFKITQKDKNHVSNLYGNFVDAEGTVVQKDVDTSKQKPPEGTSFAGAKMPFFLRFNGGVGMHAGRLPGRAASHGCVRLPRNMAEHFFNNTELGTPVTVVLETPAPVPEEPKKKKWWE
jgi:lipoprotein-anchoring transpeptidase ErfK/SrfK